MERWVRWKTSQDQLMQYRRHASETEGRTRIVKESTRAVLLNLPYIQLNQPTCFVVWCLSEQTSFAREDTKSYQESKHATLKPPQRQTTRSPFNDTKPIRGLEESYYNHHRDQRRRRTQTNADSGAGGTDRLKTEQATGAVTADPR